MSLESQRRSASHRQEEITRFILDRGTATIADISEAFGVSVMTVHRDLNELSRQGVVRKFRGGVSALPSGVFESSVRFRLSSMVEAKEAIAKEARALIEPGMSILLDEGTTTLALARMLADIAPLTVITSYLETIKVLTEFRETRLISLGGEYRSNHDSFIGVQCIAALETMRTDIAFLSTSAVGRGAAYHQEQEIVLVKRAMMASASQRILLVDHSKLMTSALHRFAQLSEFDLLITDDGLSPEQRDDLVNHAVQFRLAPLV